MNPRPRLLIVDDEATHLRALTDTLGGQGYETAGFGDGNAALAALRAGKYDLLLTDLMMPGINGIALLEAARQVDADLISIIMTGEGTIATAVEAMRAGAFDYILKPFKLSAILPVPSRALAVRELRLRNAALERRVHERTLELEAANKELEAFSYSVSHDLRGPLTAILGGADALAEYAHRMPADAQKLLTIVLRSSERMSALIDDLLRLSQLGRQPLEKQPIDMQALIAEVLDELASRPEAGTIDVHVGPLASCNGDRGLLKQVFTNLLSNAYKFSRQAAAARVEVSCEGQAGANVYCVRDNGAGFDMRHAAELFVAFKRLHDTKQFEGTGIGLSIAQRVVQRHAGRIWAEAAPGQGAAFFVSLPD